MDYVFHNTCGMVTGKQILFFSFPVYFSTAVVKIDLHKRYIIIVTDKMFFLPRGAVLFSSVTVVCWLTHNMGDTHAHESKLPTKGIL